MKKNLLVLLLTSIVLIALYEFFSNKSFQGDREKYLNPLIINKGLIQSIRNNHLEHIDKYLGYKKLKINTETHKGNTPLLEAIMSEKLPLEYFNKILSVSNVNHINKNSFRPIHIAITAKRAEKVKIILNTKGFDQEVLFNGKNLIEFTESIKKNEKDIRGRLVLNEIVDLLSRMYPKMLEKSNKAK